MRYLIFLLIIVLAGCASVPMPGYIGRIDHPYERKIQGSLDKVVSSTIFVLKNKGWPIIDEVDSSIYERDDRYDNNGYQNLLIMTDVRKQYRVLYSTSMHLNVFIHSIGNTCDMEIRYEAQTPLVKRFISVRNDRVVQDILDAIEQEVNRP
jgi:hypothetical protein